MLLYSTLLCILGEALLLEIPMSGDLNVVRGLFFVSSVQVVF